MKEHQQNNPMEALNALSPVDGRYRSKTQELRQYFSESALIKYRIQVEVEYFIQLHDASTGKLSPLRSDQINFLRSLYHSFGDEDAVAVKDIEKITNHDVKAVEYHIKNKLNAHEDEELISNLEYIHFGLTSQDINNTSFPLMLKDALDEVIIPAYEDSLRSMEELAAEHDQIAMLAKTHGQPASPTRLGKEIKVFAVRLERIINALKSSRHSGKFGGATGNLNAHKLAHPEQDWIAFASGFLKRLGLERQELTTQIEHYDDLAAILYHLNRANTVLIDFARDIWSYISMNYFKQKIVANEVGSSAMPHKVNPIDFENAEGNLGFANAMMNHLAGKLPVSRLQRDLTDSTVLRNLGLPLGHILIALKSIKKGIGKLELNKAAIDKDLEENWAVVAEAIQTILRREAYPNPYEKLKELTRNHKQIDAEVFKSFIDELDVKVEVKEELLGVTPWTYTGY